MSGGSLPQIHSKVESQVPRLVNKSLGLHVTSASHVPWTKGKEATKKSEREYASPMIDAGNSLKSI